MQAIVTGFFFIANGLGSMLGSLLFELISLACDNKFVYQENVDFKKRHIGDLKGQLYYYFFGLAALNLINMILFTRYSARKMAKNVNRTQQDVRDYIRSATLQGTPKK